MANKLLTFSYIATNAETNLVRGDLKAMNESSALAQINRMGLELISLSSKKESILDMELTFFEKVKPNDIYNFTRQLSVMLKAGVPLIDALDSVHSDQSNPLLSRTIQNVILKEYIARGTYIFPPKQSLTIKNNSKCYC